MRFLELVVLFFFLLSASTFGAEETITASGVQAALGEFAMVAPAVAESPRVDGELDDAAWQRIPPLTLSYVDERVPGLPRDHTRVRTACDADGKCLYVAFECRETVQNLDDRGVERNDPSILN